MSRSVRFKLSGYDLDLALALVEHANKNLGVPGGLDEIVKQQFLKFLYDSVDTGATNEGRAAVDTRDTQSTTLQSEGSSSDPLADTKIAVDSPAS